MQTEDDWYAYDSMNRVAISQGSLSSASAAPGSFTVTAAVNTLQGVAAAVYDDGTQWSVIASANGLTGDTATTVLATGTVLRIPIAVEPGTSDTSTNTDVWARTNLTGGMALSYNADGEEMTSTTIDMAPNGSGGNFAQVTQNDYSYTADGELVGVSVGQSTVSAPNLVSSFATQATYTRDALGRILTQTEYDTSANDDTSALGGVGKPIESIAYTYDLDSHVLSEQSATIQYNVSSSATDDAVTTTTFNYGTANTIGTGYIQNSSYADGNVVSQNSTTNIYSGTSGTGTPTSTTSVYTFNSYVWANGAQQWVITQNTSGSTNGSTTSTFSYDNNDNVTQDVVTGVGAHTNYYTTTAAGMIMTSQEILSSGNQTSAPETFYYYFNDQLIGQIGNNGGTAIAQPSGSANYTSSIDDYSSGVTDQTMTDNGSGPFVGNNTGGIPTANFDENLNPITPTGNGSTPAGNMYTVQNGQTLQSIAAAVYGDANLWYVIAGANGLTASSNLAVGTVLTLPNTVENAGNTASTFKPYNANEALGDVSPGAPVPATQGGGACGVIGQIIVAIVTAVTVAVAVASGLGPLGVALAGAEGNLEGQGINVLLGNQSSINWNQVGIAGVSAGVTSGLSALGVAAQTGSQFVDLAINGAAANAITQGISVATGLQPSFSWANVAAAGIQAGVAGEISQTDSAKGLGQFGDQLVSGAAGAIAYAATRSVLTGTDFGSNVLAALPQSIGNTIGNAVAGSIDSSQDTSAQGQGGGGLDPVDQEALGASLQAQSSQFATQFAAQGAAQNDAMLVALNADTPDPTLSHNMVTVLDGTSSVTQVSQASTPDWIQNVGFSTSQSQHDNELLNLAVVAQNGTPEQQAYIQAHLSELNDAFAKDQAQLDASAASVRASWASLLYGGPALPVDPMAAALGQIYDPPIGNGGVVFNAVFDTVLTGGAGLAVRGVAAAIRGIGAVAEAVPSTIDQLSFAASRAAATVGPGSGPVYGTAVHSAFQDEVDALGNANLTTEQSYLNGELVPYGTSGSVRLDVVEGPLNNPTAFYDLKTGTATLTPSRIMQIQSHLPGGNSVPGYVVHP